MKVRPTKCMLESTVGKIFRTFSFSYVSWPFSCRCSRLDVIQNPQKHKKSVEIDNFSVVRLKLQLSFMALKISVSRSNGVLPEVKIV